MLIRIDYYIGLVFLICLNPLADANIICGSSEQQKISCLKETKDRFNKKDCDDELFFILQELIDPINISESNSTPEYVNRSKNLLGLLYAEGCGIEQNLYKAEELWMSVIEDPDQKEELTSETSYIDGNEITSVTKISSPTTIEARKYLEKYSSSYGFPGGDVAYLKSRYQMYFVIRRCHESNELYISSNDFEKAKKSMRKIDDMFKSKGMNTDKIYREFENDWSSSKQVLALFDILDLVGIPSIEMITGCNIAFKTLTNIRSSSDPKGIKDF